MKRRNVALPIMALGLALSSVFASIPIGAKVALADDYDNGDRPAWSYRCDRQWDPQYCLPNRGNTNTRNSDWRNDRDWRSQDWSRIQAWCDRQGWRNSDGRYDPDWQRSQEWCNRQDWRNNQDWRNSQDWRNRDRSRRLSTGTYIPTSIERRRQIVLRRWDDRSPLTLVVTRDVQDNRSGRVVIRRDSRIEGELVSRNGGYRFEADRIRLPNGNTEDISAVSRVISGNDYSDRYRRRADISSAAIIVISSVLRGSQPNPNVFGSVFDPRADRSRNDEVVIYPDQDLDLKLTRDFSLN